MAELNNPSLFEAVAFMSYSRRDSPTAKRLQRDLEWYRIPGEFQKALGIRQPTKYLRPIILDRTDMEVRPESFWADVERRLTQSRFLIVLCSPHAANSESVEREVRYFLGLRSDASQYVIPVIVNGRPHSSDPALECFPPSLRALENDFAQRNFPTFIDATPQEVVLQTAAFLLSASYTVLHDRYQRVRRRRMRRWLAGSVAASLLFAAIASYALIQRSQAQRALVGEQVQRKAAEAERDRANQQTTIAKASAHETFLRSARSLAANRLLSWLIESKQPTTADAVREAAGMLDEGAFKKHPVIEAGLRMSIGIALRNLGHLDDADRELTRAVNLFREATGKTGGLESEDLKFPEGTVRLSRKEEFLYGDELAHALSELAQLRLAQKKPSEGEILLREAIDRINPPPDAEDLVKLRASITNEPPDTVVTYRALLAQMQAAQGNDSGAEATWRQAISEGATLKSPVPMAEASMELGQFLESRKNSQEAKKVYLQAIGKLHADQEGETRARGRLSAVVANICASDGEMEEADRRFREAVTLLRGHFRSGLKTTYASVVRGFVGFLYSREQFEECEKVCREDLAFCRQSPRARDEDIARALYNLGYVVTAQKRWEEAAQLLRDALSRATALPSDGEFQSTTRSLLESCLHVVELEMQRDGKIFEAEPILRERYQLQFQTLRPAVSGEEMYRTAVVFAKLLERGGKRQEQEDVLRRAIEIGRVAYPNGSAELATAINDLGTCLRDRNALDEAARMLEEAVAMSLKWLPPGSADIAISTANLGMLFLVQGKTPEAERLFRSAVEMVRTAMPAGDVKRSQVILGLAVILMAKESYAETEPLLREILEPRRGKTGSPPTEQDGMAGVMLKKLLRQVGRGSEADRVDKEFELPVTP